MTNITTWKSLIFTSWDSKATGLDLNKTKVQFIKVEFEHDIVTFSILGNKAC